MTERTLAIIKPDAWPQHGGAIITMATEAGLVPVEMKVTIDPVPMPRMTALSSWALFYAEHRDRPFFKSLVEFMASGPVLAMVLEGEDAIKRWRALMGPTDSRKAARDTVRGRFGASQAGANRCPSLFHPNISWHIWNGDVCGSCRKTKREVEQDIADYPMWRNAVHGSDSPEAARREIDFFFGGA